MPYFDYRARTAQGDLLTGVLEGADTNGVANYLFNIGVTPVDIRLAPRQDPDAGESLWQRLTSRQSTSLDILLFSRQMHSLLKAGVPLLRGLAGLQESTPNRAFARVLRKVRESLDAGNDLSSSLRSHPAVFNAYYVSMVQVGEMTGKLADIFPRLHDHLELEHSVKEEVASALRYPKFVLIAILGAIGIMNVYVVPAFEKVFARYKTELPLMTRILVGLSDFTMHNWPVLLVLAAGLVVGTRLVLATPGGRYRWDKAKLRLPIAGDLLLKGTMARFARSYALAYRNGIPVAQALTLVSKTVDNAYVSSRIEQIRDGVERGETLYRTAYTSGVFTPVALQMIAVGEESGGDMDKLMDEVAEMYERELRYAVKTLGVRVEPLVILVMASLVLILALGVFLPMWNLGSTINPKFG
jgi:MSHA biogenesis protein MshG